MSEPKVRFKQADGSSYPDIKQVPFGDVVKPFVEKTKTENEDVLLSCAIDGVFLNTELFGHQRGASNKGYKRIRRNTLILSAQNLHLGNANVNQRFDHGIISPAYNTYDIVGCDPDYMAQWVKRDATKKFFYDATTTGASQCRRNVDWNALYKQIFYLPCEEEQREIADFLSSVDEVIAANEQEIINLETQKKVVMKKIFSQEVRFKKEDGMLFPDWKNCHVFDVVEQLSSGKSVNSSSEIPGVNDVSVLKTSCVYHDIFNINERKKVVEDELMFVKCPLKKDNLIVSRMNTPEWVGACGYVYEEYSNVYLPDRLWQISISQDLAVALFVYELLVSPVYKRKIKDIASGTSNSMFNIAQNDFLRINIFLPCLEEQHLIADFLSDYDEAISSAKKELELWKKLKKGLLQQMFV